MNGIETRFKKGNKAAEIYTEDEVLSLFDKMRDNTITNDDILSLQDAHHFVNMFHSTLYYLISKFPELDNYKNDIANIIISRINKGALKGERSGGYNSTAAIWRSKQLGEKDTQHQKTEHSGEVNIKPKEWV